MKVLAVVLAASVASAFPHGPDADAKLTTPTVTGSAATATASANASSAGISSAAAKPTGSVISTLSPAKSPVPAAAAAAPVSPFAPKDGLQVGAGKTKTKTPDGCRKIASDEGWPAEAEWKAALPDIQGRSPKLAANVYRPDYSIRAESWKDVQDAVKFTSKNNLRLTVINSGHDFLGRNDAPSGLSLDVSLFKGIKVLESFEPTAKGAEKPAASPNVITPVNGKQAAVTFGVAVSSQELHNQLSKSKLVSIGAAHGSVAPAGGFGQTAGHGPLSTLYGLGADQFLEFKVVTADGELKIANKAVNQDLFWALRGGGGSTFGVVVEATVKAHPDVPVTLTSWQINTTSAGSDGLWQAYANLHTHFVDLVENNGVSGYYYIYPNSIKATFLHSGEFAGEAKAKKVWEPILSRMSEFPSMMKASITIKEHPTYKAYFDARFGSIDAGAMQKKEPNPWDADQQRNVIEKRHGPGTGMEMAGAPVPQPMANLDSQLLPAEAFSHPNLTSLLKAAAPFELGAAMSVIQGHLVSGKKTHKPDDDTSVNPAWRKAYTHTIGYNVPGKTSVDSLRTLAPNSGAYSNEAFAFTPNWKQSFWGSNYEKLSQIKTKYDPQGVFWVTPGINADHYEVKENRVCKVVGKVTDEKYPPQTDNLNSGRVMKGSIN